MKTLELLPARGGRAPLYVPFFFFTVLLSTSLSAQIVYWDFTGGSMSGQSTESYIVAEDAYTGPGVATSGFPDDACSNGEPWSVRGWYNTSSIFQAVSRGDYVAFPLSVEPGYGFYITGVSFSANRSVNSSGDDYGPRIWGVYSSHDGYASVLFSGRNSMGETGAGASCDFNFGSVDIPVRGGENITFRIYAYGDASTEISTMRFDDFTVEGVFLPIELASFTAREEGGRVHLAWQTYAEEENAYMAVERSADGRNFREIGRVAGAGTTQLQRDYRFTDDQPLNGVNYYRLRQVDFDGAEEIHPPVSVQVRRPGGAIQFFPSLADAFLSVRFPAPPERDGHLFIFDMLGRIVRQVEVPAGTLQQQFDIGELVTGTYTLQYRAGREVNLLGRFAKQ